MKKLILLSLTIVFAFHFASAQYSGAKNGVAFRLINTNYHWPITKEFSTLDFAGIGLEMEYIRHLNDYLNFSVPARLHKGNIPLDDQGRFQSMALASMDLLLQLKLFKESHLLYPYVYTGIRGISEDLTRDISFAAPIGAALNLRVFKHSYIGVKAELGLGFKEFRNHFQVGAGLLVLLGDGEVPMVPKATPDKDHDGIADHEDLCPEVAGLAGLNGCPDSDGDGVSDGEDDCPAIAGIKALMGCPDRDNDGVADQKDECPDKAGLIENKGCPLAADADRDGIPDALDDCPDQPGEAATNGCPDADKDGISDSMDDCPNNAGPKATRGCPDTDKDGVLDKIDKCPDQPGPITNNGCPAITEEDKATLEYAVQAVQFETASAILKPASYEILDKIVDILKRNTAHKLNISGHTDSVGSSEDNQQLSEKRAKACFDYLVAKGIKDYRISYKGYGESVPVADNKYKEGRDRNRRVEFNLFIE